MSQVLGDAGRAFLKAFGSGLLVVLIGISQQNTLHGAVAIGVAGLAASFGMGLAAVQVFVPALSFRKAFPGITGALIDSFVHASLGAFIVAVIGILAEPNYSAWHSLIIAAVVGSINVGLRAVQAFFTPGEPPSPGSGFRPLTVTHRQSIEHPNPVTIAPA